MKWWKARKKPVEILVRAVESKEDIFLPKKTGGTWVKGETIETREGTLKAVSGRDFIIKGVEGEFYPITKEIFYKTYDILWEA